MLARDDLRDKIAKVIRGFHPAETRWEELSAERKAPWLEDADRVLAVVNQSLTTYFRALRFDENHHLGLGDIRMTLGDQEELLEALLSGNKETS